MKEWLTIEGVAKAGLCTGCGTCAGICPRDAVQMVIDRRLGLYLPVVDRGNCSECGLCLAVCPGHRVDFRQLNRDVFGRELQANPLGDYLKCVVGYARDYDTRYNAASGGLVTTLLVHALEEGLIDGALVTRMSQENPLEPQPFVARTRDEIVSAARSKYCPVPANVALREILKAGDGQRFAVVGLPCHIQGLRKAETTIKKLRDRVTVHFGLVCSHSDSFQGTDFLLRKYGVRRQDVARIDYRGRGWPGCLAIRTRDGAERTVPFDDYITAHAGYFFAPRRCTLCCDMGARLSDASFMDCWLPEVKAQDSIGTSIAFCRSEDADRLFRSAAQRGLVDLRELPGSDTKRIRGMSRIGNRDLKALMQFARLRGIPVPEYAIDVPRSRVPDYLRAAVIQVNMLTGSKGFLRGLVDPLIKIEAPVFRRVKSRLERN